MTDWPVGLRKSQKVFDAVMAQDRLQEIKDELVDLPPHFDHWADDHIPWLIAEVERWRKRWDDIPDHIKNDIAADDWLENRAIFRSEREQV